MANNLIHFDESNFDITIAKGVTLVDFWAEWCGPCKMLLPVIDTLASELEGKANIGKVNVDEVDSLAMRYGIMSIPTVIVFKDGELKEKIVGLRQKQMLLDTVKKYL